MKPIIKKEITSVFDLPPGRYHAETRMIPLCREINPRRYASTRKTLQSIAAAIDSFEEIKPPVVFIIHSAPVRNRLGVWYPVEVPGYGPEGHVHGYFNALALQGQDIYCYD